MPTLHPDLPLLRLAGRSVLPIVQGGMGVGVSAHRLAGAVASYNAVGTVSSVDLRRHHPDLMERHIGLNHAAAKDAINQANLEALDREVRAARDMAGNRGIIAVNVMRAVADYANLVRQSCASGADAIVVGAGLPLDLPELAADFPNVALVPILSDARGIALILKKWERKGRLPDAIVIEHPRLAGGHLGAARIEDLNDPRFDFENVLPDTLKLLRAMGAEGRIALVPAGGINSPQRVRQLFAMGANAVQLGTPFVATEECDADPVFKQTLAQAKPEDIVEFMSVAGLPARAVRTPWLDRYLSTVQRLQAKVAARAPQLPRCRGVFDCLAQCGLRDGIAKIGQFCIDHQLAASLKGDLMHGLFFRGKEALPFGDQIRTVRELLALMLDKPIAEITALRDQVEAMFAPTTNDVA